MRLLAALTAAVLACSLSGCGWKEDRDRAFDIVERGCGARGVEAYDIEGQTRIAYVCGTGMRTRGY